MKKLLSLILALVMLTSLFAVTLSVSTAVEFNPTADKLSAIPRGSDVIARFVVGSDIHTGYGESVAKLKNAYAAMKKIGGVDAFIAAGDLTEHGSAEELAEYQSIVAANSRELTIEVDGFKGKGAGNGAAVGTTISMLGNHENYNSNIETDFREQIGQETEGIYWINDKVPVIKVSLTMDGATNWPCSFETKHDYIESAVKEVASTGYKGHIFLISHIAFAETVFGSDAKGDDRYSPETVEFLKNYPQLVHVSGHSHATPMNPGVIDQSAGFTSIVTGTVGKYFRQSDDDLYGSSFTVFDVKSDGTTELYRVDLSKGELIYGNEEWVLDSSDKPSDFIYFKDPAKATNKNAYALKGSAPKYGSGATVTAKDLGTHDGVEVSFTANATPASDKNYDYVSYYTVKATPKKGGDVITSEIYNDPALKGGETLTTALYGLEYNTDYEISVTASTAFGKESAPVKYSGTINVGSLGVDATYPVKTLYCMDYSYGDSNEFKGHETKPNKVNKIVYDEEIDKKAVSFHGAFPDSLTFDNADIDDIRYGFTLEAYFKPTDVTSYQQVVNFVDAELNLAVDNGVVGAYFTVNAEKDSYSVCDVPVNANEWVHIIVTYDGKRARLYKNGELIATELNSGGLAASETEGDGTVKIGGYNMNVDTLAKGSLLNMFSLSAGVMTDADVKAAYEKTTAQPKSFDFTDVAEGDWFYPTVQYAYQTGLMNGTSAKSFEPTTKTSRAMIVQMLYNMEGKPEVEYKPIFTDVAENAWYADAVIWAYESGVTTGSSATTFSPDALVTREQVAVFLYRFLKDYKGEEMATGADLSSFTDAGEISPYAGFAEAMAWANGVGIVTGKTSADKTILAPVDQAQRCETATMFARLHKMFVR